MNNSSVQTVMLSEQILFNLCSTGEIAFYVLSLLRCPQISNVDLYAWSQVSRADFSMAGNIPENIS